MRADVTGSTLEPEGPSHHRRQLLPSPAAHGVTEDSIGAPATDVLPPLIREGEVGHPSGSQEASTI